MQRGNKICKRILLEVTCRFRARLTRRGRRAQNEVGANRPWKSAYLRPRARTQIATCQGAQPIKTHAFRLALFVPGGTIAARSRRCVNGVWNVISWRRDCLEWSLDGWRNNTIAGPPRPLGALQQVSTCLPRGPIQPSQRHARRYRKINTLIKMPPFGFNRNLPLSRPTQLYAMSPIE